MIDYEEKYVELLKRTGKLSRELSNIHNELCSLYLEKCIENRLENTNKTTTTEET